MSKCKRCTTCTFNTDNTDEWFKDSKKKAKAEPLSDGILNEAIMKLRSEKKPYETPPRHYYAPCPKCGEYGIRTGYEDKYGVGVVVFADGTQLTFKGAHQSEDINPHESNQRTTS